MSGADVPEETVPHEARPPRAPVPTVSRAELERLLLGEGPRPALFEVLPTGYWRKNHLPGAASAPPDEAVAIITAAVPDKQTPIVVYCWDPG